MLARELGCEPPSANLPHPSDFAASQPGAGPLARLPLTPANDSTFRNRLEVGSPITVPLVDPGSAPAPVGALTATRRSFRFSTKSTVHVNPGVGLGRDFLMNGLRSALCLADADELLI